MWPRNILLNAGAQKRNGISMTMDDFIDAIERCVELSVIRKGNMRRGNDAIRVIQ